jgi:hypothetical protein
MDQGTLVEDQIADGQRLITQLAHDNVPVRTAFWLKTGEEGRWHLYIATKAVDELGPKAAYRLVAEALQRLPRPQLSPFDIKLISPTSVLVPLVEQRLDGVSVEEAYVYPPQGLAQRAATVTSEDVVSTVLALLKRTGVVKPSVVTLLDGSAFQGTPFGVELVNGTLTVKFIDAATNAQRVVPAADVTSIA